VFPDDAGRLMKAGSRIGWGNVHMHASGVPGDDRNAHMDLGLRLHPMGYKPKYAFTAVGFGRSEIEVDPNEGNQKTDAYWVAPGPIKLLNFEPHLHAAGVRMCIEAINVRSIETLSCSGYDHNWVRTYYFDDNSAPLLPKGTILKTTAWFDSTPNNTNVIDPRNQSNWGRRSVNNMFMVFNYLVNLSDDDYAAELAKRRAYLDQADGWDNVIGCPGCWERPSQTQPAARATR